MSAGDIFFVLIFVFSLVFELFKKASKKKPGSAPGTLSPEPFGEASKREDIPGRFSGNRPVGKKPAATQAPAFGIQEDTSLPASSSAKKEKIDKKKLVIYSEIMKPKYF